MILRNSWLLVLLALLAACAPEDSTSKNVDTQDDSKTLLEQATSTQLDALENAQSLEKSLQSDADQRQKEMEKKGI